MTSRPRASPASWPNPAPVPASPRSAPLFEPLCPPVARGSPTRPVMCCCSPPKLRVCLLPEPRVSRSRLPPHDSASCPVTGGDPPRWVPGKPHRKILCFPSPRSPRRCVLSPCGPTRPLNPRGAARFWPAAASGSQSCPAFPFSVHFGIWTLPVRPSLASVLCGFPWVCVLSCFCVYSERAPLPARLSAPFARSLAVKILTGCLWAPGTKDRVCGGGAADRPPPGGAPLPLGAGTHGGTGLAVPCQDRALRHLHWFCLSGSSGQTISAFLCHEPHAGSASQTRIRSTPGQPHRCRHPLSLLVWPPHPWAWEPRGLDVCPSLDRHTRSRSPPRTPPASPPVPSVPVSASGGAVGSLRASAPVFVFFLRPRAAAAWGSKGVSRCLSHRPLAEGAQTHRHGSQISGDGSAPARRSFASAFTGRSPCAPLAILPSLVCAHTHPPPSTPLPRASCARALHPAHVYAASWDECRGPSALAPSALAHQPPLSG